MFQQEQILPDLLYKTDRLVYIYKQALVTPVTRPGVRQGGKTGQALRDRPEKAVFPQRIKPFLFCRLTTGTDCHGKNKRPERDAGLVTDCLSRPLRSHFFPPRFGRFPPVFRAVSPRLQHLSGKSVVFSSNAAISCLSKKTSSEAPCLSPA